MSKRGAAAGTIQQNDQRDFDYLGCIARVLIVNQMKGRLTDVKELKNACSINKIKLDELMHSLQFYLQQHFELDLIEYHFEDHQDKEKKYFIRKLISPDFSSSSSNNPDPEVPAVSIEDKRLYSCFICIQIGRNEVKNIENEMEKCKYFKNINISDWINKIKRLGYISSKISEDDNASTVTSFGWRYYIDYGDWFDVIEKFKNKKL